MTSFTKCILVENFRTKSVSTNVAHCGHVALNDNSLLAYKQKSRRALSESPPAIIAGRKGAEDDDDHGEEATCLSELSSPNSCATAADFDGSSEKFDDVGVTSRLPHTGGNKKKSCFIRYPVAPPSSEEARKRTCRHNRRLYQLPKYVSFAMPPDMKESPPHSAVGEENNFDGTSSSNFHSQEMSVSDLWYGPRDFERFQRQAQHEAAAIQWNSEAKFHLDALTESHAIVCRLANQIRKLNEKQGGCLDKEAFLWSQIFQRIEVPETGLVQWCLTSFRGLERFASTHIRHSKSSARRKMWRELALQDSPEDLAVRMQQRSQTSRLFARMVGLADELAARYANQTIVCRTEN